MASSVASQAVFAQLIWVSRSGLSAPDNLVCSVTKWPVSKDMLDQWDSRGSMTAPEGGYLDYHEWRYQGNGNSSLI